MTTSTKTASAASILLGLLLLGAGAWAVWAVARLGVGWAGGLDDRTLAPLALPLTLVACALVIANGLRAAARREERREERAARAAVYERFLRFARTGAPPGESAVTDQQMMLYATPAVLDGYLRLRHAEMEAGPADGDARRELAQLVALMRRELWHRTSDASVAQLEELLALPVPEPAVAPPAPTTRPAMIMGMRR